MRIATYNIHGWRTEDFRPNLDLVANTLSAAEADIIGLNEVVHTRTTKGAERSKLEILADRLGMHVAFGACVRWPAQGDMPDEVFGNALLSRWPIAASAGHLLAPVEHKEQRGLLEARIATGNGRPLTVYVTHLDHTDESARLLQLRSLREWTTRDRNRPHFVVGDFNAVSPWDMDARPDILIALQAHEKGRNMTPDGGPKVIAQMQKAGYVDAYALFREPGSRSYLASEAPIRIDYIFASQPLKEGITDCTIWESPGNEGSDHLPVVADVDLPE